MAARTGTHSIRGVEGVGARRAGRLSPGPGDLVAILNDTCSHIKNDGHASSAAFTRGLTNKMGRIPARARMQSFVISCYQEQRRRQQLRR